MCAGGPAYRRTSAYLPNPAAVVPATLPVEVARGIRVAGLRGDRSGLATISVCMIRTWGEWNTYPRKGRPRNLTTRPRLRLRLRRRDSSARTPTRPRHRPRVSRLLHRLIRVDGRARRRGAAGEVEGGGSAETLPEGIDAAAELGSGVAVDEFAFVGSDAGRCDEGRSCGACNCAEG